jgi:hypothetical protein
MEEAAASSQLFSARRCSLISLLVGPAQFPIDWFLVTVLRQFGLYEVHTGKELFFIFIYTVGALVAIILALMGLKKGMWRSPLAWFAIALAVLNLFPALIIMSGW